MKEKCNQPGKDNIILIGMPGAGKSTLGIVLAKILNYNFVDADLVIQNQCDKTLQKLLDACGPDGFIEMENQVLSDMEFERTVVATGGLAPVIAAGTDLIDVVDGQLIPDGLRLLYQKYLRERT